jgi:hypothetical protein
VSLRRFARSRPDCVQVVIALVVTPEGLPLAYEVLPGNTACRATSETGFCLTFGVLIVARQALDQIEPQQPGRHENTAGAGRGGRALVAGKRTKLGDTEAAKHLKTLQGAKQATKS